MSTEIGNVFSMLEKEQTAPLADQAYELIRDEIILGRLKPGEVVSETTLEERYQIARAAVRSAIAQLIGERLIKAVGKKSRIIAPLTVGDIHDIFLLRRELEPLAARLAAGNVSEELLRVLDEACRRAYEPGNKKGELAFLDANRRFHLAIGRASGSPRLTQMLEHLHNEASRILYLGFRNTNRSKDWTHGHENLLEALVRPSPEEAERIALQLLDKSYEDVMRAVITNPKFKDAQLA
ncbi:GntR family transcriptional regulator [Nitratireductor sp. GZWM139]|uniref:GntR family transcriptional regulator n=1 Tax=Nitratireductor sp. GZWM139 TaxID=2950541 RepID=UPI0024BE1F98|nr:GntR family transcriptional regulator [Nitratireductor sp. GZWM139]MDJ1466115.1 GntR family transcriptional regulator [Nitratireductor sp. GZWM139]